VRERLDKRHPSTVDIPAALDVIEETVMFGGHLMNHYGHFLLESMSRLWARDLHPDLKIVFTRPGQWRSPPAYWADIVDSLNLRDRIKIIDKPTLLRKVVCPLPTITYRRSVSALVDEPHLAVADALRNSVRREWHRPVYLTRSGLSDLLRKYDAEPELEAELAAIGFDIVRPEELPLAEQISIFEQAPLVVGTVGSAMHTALFSRSRGSLAVLNWGRGFENYLLVDGVKSHSSFYLRSIEQTSDPQRAHLDVPLTMKLLGEAGLLERGRNSSLNRQMASAE
jgi:capsular polysaccharide biosynthesis protein